MNYHPPVKFKQHFYEAFIIKDDEHISPPPKPGAPAMKYALATLLLTLAASMFAAVVGFAHVDERLDLLTKVLQDHEFAISEQRDTLDDYNMVLGVIVEKVFAAEMNSFEVEPLDTRDFPCLSPHGQVDTTEL